MEMEMNSVSIDGIEYVRKSDVLSTVSTDVQIVILQRGWVMVGRFSQDGENCSLDNAHVIRQWGTTKGLGQLALSGPTSKTVLDPSGHVEFHALTVVARLSTSADLWKL